MFIVIQSRPYYLTQGILFNIQKGQNINNIFRELDAEVTIPFQKGTCLYFSYFLMRLHPQKKSNASEDLNDNTEYTPLPF